MKYFLQQVSVSKHGKTKNHSIVTTECGRTLLNEEHGEWVQKRIDASSEPKREISREEYKALHKEIYCYSSRNTREEFEEMVNEFGAVICAEIIHFPWDQEKSFKINLRVGFSQEEYASFLDALDFWFNSSYGEQFVEGTVWFQDGTWATRCGYDGAESWEHHKCPTIPAHLQ